MLDIPLRVGLLSCRQMHLVTVGGMSDKVVTLLDSVTCWVDLFARGPFELRVSQLLPIGVRGLHAC